MSRSFAPTLTDTTPTQIRNQRLLWMLRVTGWAILGLCGFIIALNIPYFYQYVIDAVDNSPRLRQIGISPEGLALFRSAIRRLGEIIYFIVAARILWRSKDLMAIMLAITLALMSVTLSGSTIELAQAFPSGKILWNITGVLSVCFGALILFTLPDSEFLPRWSKLLIRFFVPIEALRQYLLYELDIAGWIRLAFFVPLVATYGLGLVAQHYRYQYGDTIYRHQFRWFIMGVALTLTFILIQQIGYLVLLRDFHILIAGLDELGSIFLALSCIFAITHYRLYDINLYLNRLVVYAGVLVGLIPLFIGLFVVLQRIFGLFLSNTPTFNLVLPAVIVGILFNPVRNRVQSLVDRRLYGFRFDLNQLQRMGAAPLDVSKPGTYTRRNIGGFELFNVIGKGGMGEVYLAYAGDGRMAAIKILAPTMLVDDHFSRRFEHEARLTAALHHPNIVQLYDAGSENDLHYLILEYVAGMDLKQLLHEHGKLNLELLIEPLRDIAAALDYAHAKGFIHRDIKPSNIMMRLRADNETYQAILTDFGVAKLRGNMGSSLTDDGVVGTIDYMAPEQIHASQQVNHQADIYALGVVVYEVLTGERPFKGTLAQMLFAHIHQPPPNPRDVIPDLPESAAQAISRALAKDPADRYPNVKTFVDDLLAEV